MLLTTHYMDEADKLCDRIAIVDHGELKALDSPMKLKASIPGKNVLEVSFSRVPAGWAGAPGARCRTSRASTGDDDVFRIAIAQRPGDDAGADGAAARAPASPSSRCRSRARRSTTCSCTTPGAALRDALQEASAAGQPVHDAGEG